MKVVSIKRMLILITVIAFAAVSCLTVQNVWAAGTDQSSTKAVKKVKTVSINIIVKAEKDAEVDIIIEKKSKKKKKAVITKTVELKKGMNYFTYNKGKKGNYSVTVMAYGDTLKQNVTAVQGAYTLYFSVAPPKDGDDKKTKPIEYQDITKLK